MAIDTIKSSAVLDGAIATADIADDAVTGAKIENNPTIAGNLTVSGNFTSQGIDDNADATAITVDSSERVMIGTTTEGSAGADELTVGSTSGSNGITIRAATSGTSSIYMSDATSGAGEYAGYIAYSHGSDSMALAAAGGQRIRIDADGLKFGGDTAAANALDDYEEGTWTPFYTTANNNLTLNGNASTTSSMYTTQGGSYIKIGRKVICHMSIATNGVTSHGGSGYLWIGGLPFTTVTVSAAEPRGVNGAMAGRFSSFTPDQLVCNTNATTLQIRAGFESYPTRSNLDTGGSSNRNVIEALIVYSTA